MYMKRLWKTNEYDVFVGTGWSNWVRVKHDEKKREVERVMGFIPLTSSLAQHVLKRIESFQRTKQQKPPSAA